MLASMNWTQWLLSMVLICVCLFLMLVILLQRGRGGGIASAFGGGGGSGAFGAKTGDVFTWITCIVAGIFVILAVVANFAFDASKLSVDTPAVAAEQEGSKTELIPVKVGDDGTALPINIEGKPVGATGIESVTITPSPAPATTAPAPAAPATPPTGAANEPAKPDPAAGPAATPPAEADKPAEKPKEEPATP